MGKTETDPIILKLACPVRLAARDGSVVIPGNETSLLFTK
jgi:hypothetical protein